MPGPPRPAVNTQTKVLDLTHGRILCIADIRGNISHLNALAAEANADAIIHTGDFGFIGESVPLVFTSVYIYPLQMQQAWIGSATGQSFSEPSHFCQGACPCQFSLLSALITRYFIKIAR